MILVYLAQAEFRLGDLESVWRRADEAIARWDGVRPDVVAAMEMLQGRVTHLTGDLAHAQTLFERAGVRFAGSGDAENRMVTLLARANLHVSLDELDEATALATEVLTWASAAGLVDHEIQARWVLAHASNARGDRDAALAELRACLALAEEHRSIHTGAARVMTARELLDRGRIDEAEPLLRAALEDEGLQRNPYSAAATHLSLGMVEKAQGDLDAAERSFGHVIRDLGEEVYPSLLADAHIERGLVRSELGRWDEAAADMLAAGGYLELERAQLPTEELRMTTFEKRNAWDVLTELFVVRIERAVRAGDEAAARRAFGHALGSSERRKARELLAILDRPEVGAALAVDRAVRARRAAASRQLSTAQARIRARAERGDPPEPDLDAALDAATHAFEDAERRVRAASPRRTELERPAIAPADLAAIRAAVPDGGALVVYALTDPVSFAFVVTEEGEHVARLAPREELEADARGLVRLLARPPERSLPDAIATSTRSLGEKLLGPIVERLPAEAPLVIVPDGALHLLPFEVLTVPGSEPAASLLRRAPVSYAPSASVLARLAAAGGDGAEEAAGLLLALAFPIAGEDGGPGTARAPTGEPLEPLPHARAEVAANARLHDEPGVGLRGAAATEAALKRELRAHDHDTIHLAVHGLIDDETPLRSGVLLAAGEGDAEDGLFQVADILTIELRSELVVVSGCETGRGELRRGEGILGLNRALLIAGARRTCLSLWRVADAETAALMTAFHRHRRAGLSAAAALRRAKLERIDAGASPFHWAPFVLSGAH